MNLAKFFTPVNENVIKPCQGTNNWYNNITVNTEKVSGLKSAQARWKDSDIAILGVCEERGTIINKGTSMGPDEIRRKLYHLKLGTGAYKITDLGNLKPAENLEKTYLRLKEVCETLINNKVLPIILGGSHDLDYGQFLAYQGAEKLISVLNVDAMLDMEKRKTKRFTDSPIHRFTDSIRNSGVEDLGGAVEMCRHHTYRLLTYEPKFLFNFSHLAYQSYLTDQDSIASLEALHFESYRVGQIRENMEETEPVIRNADMMSFDITAIKQADAPGNLNAQPFGLTGEEACQICWYAGLNDRLTSIGFYEYNPNEDLKKQTASVIATMIWYFTEGFYNRRNELDFDSEDYKKYLVTIPKGAYAGKDDLSDMVFYKNKFTDKWWLEVPNPSGKKPRNSIVPCSYNDYQVAANKGELPKRWLLTHARLLVVE
ncbi:MAG: formimidoylglutamase [Cytophagales bacterium]|nr:formimidoylglutamase [Cytophagales bacterium]